MAKKKKPNQKMQAWIDARKRPIGSPMPRFRWRANWG